MHVIGILLEMNVHQRVCSPKKERAIMSWFFLSEMCIYIYEVEEIAVIERTYSLLSSRRRLLSR